VRNRDTWIVIGGAAAAVTAFAVVSGARIIERAVVRVSGSRRSREAATAAAILATASRRTRAIR
jgi:hypothetical protein